MALPVLVTGVYFGWFYSREKTLTWNGTARKYRLHRPLWDTAGEKRPLVVALHGYADHPWFMEAYTGWSAKADREKFFVVYPYGSSGDRDKNLSWNAGSCCGTALSENINDVGFLSNLITHLVQSYPIDGKRIYVTGFSNGALLVMRVAAENSEGVAKFGTMAGSVGGRFDSSTYFRLPTPQKLVTMILIHGKKDQIVPYAGGVNWARVAEFAPFSETARFWQDAGAKLKIVELENVGHWWPGGLLEWLSTGRRGDFSATDAMWEFFQQE